MVRKPALSLIDRRLRLSGTVVVVVVVAVVVAVVV